MRVTKLSAGYQLETVAGKFEGLDAIRSYQLVEYRLERYLSKSVGRCSLVDEKRLEKSNADKVDYNTT